jgi:serine/threonine-protein kinase HipA
MSDRAYVYACPPGEERPTLAGQVIVVATGNDGFCRFKYAREWLDKPRAFALDPDVLALADTEFESQPGWEVFGALRDAGPDYWGRKLIELRQNRLGLSELEFLLASGDARVGALAFSTERALPTGKAPPAVTQLRQLADAAARVERDEPVSADLLELLGAGTGTLGGMRPKATVEDDGRLWLAKFPSREDRHANTRWEFATLELAARCGLGVPERRLTLVNRRPVLLVARFDRQLRAGVRERAHYLSGLTMLGLHERDYGRGSYAELAHWLRRHGAAPRDDTLELFRRMVFNTLIGNTDDHLRNHAVIDFGEGLRLSPLFDVMPWPAVGGERMQAIGVGHEGRRATFANALSESGLFGLDEEAARTEVRRLAQIVREEWQGCFRSAGVEKRESDIIARILEHQDHAIA